MKKLTKKNYIDTMSEIHDPLVHFIAGYHIQSNDLIFTEEERVVFYNSISETLDESTKLLKESKNNLLKCKNCNGTNVVRDQVFLCSDCGCFHDHSHQRI
ncbi:MAG: hypothetical protein QM504_17215 [Pseudomonadota bacterium]